MQKVEIQKVYLTHPLLSVITSNEISFISLAFVNKTITCGHLSSKIVDSMKLTFSRTIIVFLTENGDLKFVNHRKRECQVVYELNLAVGTGVSDFKGARFMKIGSFLIVYYGDGDEFRIFDTISK